MIRSMGIALSGLIVAGAAAVGFAQDPAQADFQAKYEKKVAESWFTDNGFTDEGGREADLRLLHALVLAVTALHLPGERSVLHR